MLSLFLITIAQTAPLGVAPGPLPRAEAERRVAERFADLDLNEDGHIERDEVRARFDFDATADAAYTAAKKATKAGTPRAAIDARQPPFARADAWFAAVDADRDGRITRQELARHMGADVQDLGPR